LFKGDPDANYQADKYKIECADSFVADVNEITYYNKDGSEKVEYDLGITTKNKKRVDNAWVASPLKNLVMIEAQQLEAAFGCCRY